VLPVRACWRANASRQQYQVREQAERAIVEPAGLEGKEFRTLPFEYSEAALKEISGLAAGGSDEVEPLLLQVLCTRIEQKVAGRQKELETVNEQLPKVIVEPQDLGGPSGLERTLRDFYLEVITSLPRRQRKRARNLCADGLVSTDRRRLLIQGGNLAQTYRVSREVLGTLVDKHIIRIVDHLGSLYYELSHDALVPPVLGERPWRLPKRVRVGVYVLAAAVLCFVDACRPARDEK
jgi:hypothetical protein